MDQVVQRRAEGATCSISGAVTGVIEKGTRSLSLRVTYRAEKIAGVFDNSPTSRRRLSRRKGFVNVHLIDARSTRPAAMADSGAEQEYI